MTGEAVRAADLVARRLFEAGCRFAFGMPGGEVLTIVDALKKAGIEFILAKHENNAGFMAEGVHHTDGAPAVLVATVGPGALNCVNVVANAEQDRVPLIVLTGCVDADEALTYTHQVLDHQAVFSPVTKATYRLTRDGADTIADRAVSLAMEGRRGPVHIDIPISVADSVPAKGIIRRRVPASPVAPAPGSDLDRARQWVRDAKRPVMLIGLEALEGNAGAAIRDFVDALGVPFITTYKAKGIIAEDHPLCLGGAGLSPLADSILVPFVQSADLILCVGYDPIEMRTGWREIWDPSAVHVIDISSANDHYMHQATLHFVTDPAATLQALRGNASTPAGWVDGEIESARADLAAVFPRKDEWGPAAIIDECRQVLPPETVVSVDSGAHRILLSQMWTCQQPRTLLQSTGLCTMGCAVPLAMGAGLAAPDRPAVCFCGDGGMLMVAGELSTARELNSRAIFVVFVDSSLALIELKQRQRQLANAGVDFEQHDFAAIGRAFGGYGHTVRHREELRAAIEEALGADRFTVIAAIIDPQSYDGRI